jgi:hypothetical protein
MAGKRTQGTDGVGRGNGEGSKRTQFQDGMPSRNPNGRPRKPKREPNASIKDAVSRELRQLITVRENGVEEQRSQTDAMVMLMFAQFSKATIREKIAILRYAADIAPETLNDRKHEAPADALIALVERLAQEINEADEASWRP